MLYLVTLAPDDDHYNHYHYHYYHYHYYHYYTLSFMSIQGRQDYKEQITKNAVEFEPVELWKHAWTLFAAFSIPNKSY